MGAQGLTYQAAAQQAASAHGVPWPIFSALVDKLSRWSQAQTSSTGAIGLTGLTPVQGVSVGANVYDPVSNLNGGAKYLSNLYQQTGDWNSALAAYNFEPGMAGGDTAFANAVMAEAQKNGYSAGGTSAGAPNPAGAGMWGTPTGTTAPASSSGNSFLAAWANSGWPGASFAKWLEGFSLLNILIYGGTILVMAFVSFFAVKALFSGATK